MRISCRMQSYRPCFFAHVRRFASVSTAVVIDIETSGFFRPGVSSYYQNRIIEVAAVRWPLEHDDAVVPQSWSSLIRLDRKLPPKIIELTGISDAMLAGAPRSKDVLQQLRDFCGDDDVVVGHNVQFDLTFLEWEYAHSGVKLPKWLLDGAPRRICTMALARKVFPGRKSYSLEKLLEDLAVADGTSRATTEAFHRALQDAMATKVLYAKCVEKLPPRPTPMACPHQHVLDCLSQGKFAP